VARQRRTSPVVTDAIRRRIVVATPDSIGERMAGPAIRAWNIAGALARQHDVELVTTTPTAERSSTDFKVRAVSDDELRRLVDWCDIFLFQGWIMVGREFIARSDRIVVADVYDPMHLEQLEQAREAGEAGRAVAIQGATAALNEQLLRGDFFLCASEKQRDLWLGHLASLGRVNARTYDADETLRGLIDVVAFGIDDTPPVRTGPGVKGVVPGIGLDDEVVLWGGGIYNWFDPLTLIRAVDQLRHVRPNVRLVFMGGRHPNPGVPDMQMALDARRLATELGVLDTHVFFNDGWVSYDERQNYLLDADVAVSTHLDHVETAFSFRTRVLDYLWAGVPVVATMGDSLADVISERGLGLTVPPDDVEAVAAAIGRLLEDRELAASCRRHAAEIAPEMCWDRVLEPLRSFCAAPRRAPDLVDPELGPRLARARRAAAPPRSTGLRHDTGLVIEHLRTGGPRLLVQRIISRVRRAVTNSRSLRG